MPRDFARELRGLVTGELDGIDLPDRRLNGRARKIVSSVAGEPAAGFPSVMDDSELEGFYRFVGNSRVGFGSVLEPHVRQTADRMADHREVVVAHDTTLFCFGGESSRAGLSQLQKKGGQGFLGHFALAVTADEERDPLGVLGVVPVVRRADSPTQRRKSGTKRRLGEPTEQDRWLELIDDVEKKIDRPGDLIHVLDREADDYALLSRLFDKDRRFVVRLCYDRRLDAEESGSAPGQRTKEFMASRPVLCERSARLSPRAKRGPARNKSLYPARAERIAKLAIAAASVTLKRPQNYPSEGLRPLLPLNVVYVREIQAPADAVPVEWYLLTTEAVDGQDAILKLVDSYRSRWRIEEYFKALKTGCAYEKRQLESLPALLNTLALLVPVAWGLLRLRTLAREDSKRAASEVLSKTQIQVLRRVSKKRLPPNLTIQRALEAIATLGGHLKHNGPPGWQVLGRGYEKLLSLEEGFLLRLD